MDIETACPQKTENQCIRTGKQTEKEHTSTTRSSQTFKTKGKQTVQIKRSDNSAKKDQDSSLMQNIAPKKHAINEVFK